MGVQECGRGNETQEINKTRRYQCLHVGSLSSALPFCLLGSDDAKEVVLFLFEAWSFNENDK